MEAKRVAAAASGHVGERQEWVTLTIPNVSIARFAAIRARCSITHFGLAVSFRRCVDERRLSMGEAKTVVFGKLCTLPY
ncbi:MAG: hypothetical protein VXZ18_14795 [Pseudomonadota bacterium]|nr:hypothetical protein [Pseudomonadota bacterium]